MNLNEYLNLVFAVSMVGFVLTSLGSWYAETRKGSAVNAFVALCCFTVMVVVICR